jgi:hypothetical protein
MLLLPSGLKRMFVQCISFHTCIGKIGHSSAARVNEHYCRIHLHQPEKATMAEHGKDVVHNILLNNTSSLRTPAAGTISYGKQ